MADIVDTKSYVNMINALEAFAQRTLLAGENLKNYCAAAASVLPQNDAIIKNLINNAGTSALQYKRIAGMARGIEIKLYNELQRQKKEDAIWQDE